MRLFCSSSNNDDGKRKDIDVSLRADAKRKQTEIDRHKDHRGLSLSLSLSLSLERTNDSCISVPTTKHTSARLTRPSSNAVAKTSCASCSRSFFPASWRHKADLDMVVRLFICLLACLFALPSSVLLLAVGDCRLSFRSGWCSRHEVMTTSHFHHLPRSEVRNLLCLEAFWHPPTRQKERNQQEQSQHRFDARKHHGTSTALPLLPIAPERPQSHRSNIGSRKQTNNHHHRHHQEDA